MVGRQTLWQNEAPSTHFASRSSWRMEHEKDDSAWGTASSLSCKEKGLKDRCSSDASEAETDDEVEEGSGKDASANVSSR